MRITKIASMAIIIFLVIYFAVPIQSKNKLIFPVKRALGDNGQLCFDYKANVLDRLSTDIIKTEVNEENISVKFRTKNAFGSYYEDEITCEVRNASFNNELSKFIRCKDGLGNKSVEEQLSCIALERKIKEDGRFLDKYEINKEVEWSILEQDEYQKFYIAKQSLLKQNNSVRVLVKQQEIDKSDTLFSFIYYLDVDCINKRLRKVGQYLYLTDEIDSKNEISYDGLASSWSADSSGKFINLCQ